MPLTGMRATLLLCAVLLAGCAASDKGAPAKTEPHAQAPAAATPVAGTRPFVESGFLSDYSRLAPVEPGAKRHVYENPNAHTHSH